MLTKDPEKRATMKQLSEMAWLDVGYQDPLSKEL